MKITLFLATAASVVLMNTSVSANTINQPTDLSIDGKPHSPLINILDTPAMLPVVQEELQISPERLPLMLSGTIRIRKTGRVRVGGTWNTTEGRLRLNQGSLLEGIEGLLTPSPQGHIVLGDYDKRDGDIVGYFMERSEDYLTGNWSKTELKGFWTQDYSDVACETTIQKASFNYRWPKHKGMSKYWGSFQFSFKHDGTFTGFYGYCNEKPNRIWNGKKDNTPGPN